MTRRGTTRRAILAGGAAAALTMPFQSHAEAAYPGRLISYVVPFPPGATNDNAARIVARKLSEKLGQTIVIENKSGGGGSIGAEFVAKARPDGYTLLNASTGNLTIVPHLIRTGYEPFRDFTPVGYVGLSRSVFAIHPSVPAQTLQDLVAYARANPGKLNFGSAGNGSGGHLAGEYLKLRAGIDMVHVPYRGSAAAARTPPPASSRSSSIPSAHRSCARVTCVAWRSPATTCGTTCPAFQASPKRASRTGN